MADKKHFWQRSAKTVVVTNKQVDVIVNQLSDLMVNADGATIDSLRGRIGAAITGGYDMADTLHDIYLDYGYPQHVSFFNAWNMYRRFGLAKRGVTIFPNTCWESHPTIESSDKQFIRDFDIIVQKVKLWHRLKGLDTRQRVGRYAGLYMRVKDGKASSEPLEGSFGTAVALEAVQPLYESQLVPLTFNETKTDPDYGKPTMYQFSSSAVGNRNGGVAESIQIHPSRLVIAAEGADDGGIYGISALESVYNSLMDARKVSGGGGEGFYKNSSQSVVFSVKPEKNAKVDKTMLSAFSDMYDEWSSSRQRKALMAPYMDVTQLQSDLISPKEFFAVPVMDIAAGFDIPSTIMTGELTGKLASDSDTKIFRGTCQSRRENFLTEMVGDVIDWCMMWGVLPTAKYEIEWDDLLAASDTEKLDNADKLATINEKQFKSGGGLVYSVEEIRDASGHEKEVEGDMPDETLEDEIVIDDDGN